MDQPVVTKDSSKEERMDKDISKDCILYLQEADEVALEDEDGDEDSSHALMRDKHATRTWTKERSWRLRTCTILLLL